MVGGDMPAKWWRLLGRICSRVQRGGNLSRQIS